MSSLGKNPSPFRQSGYDVKVEGKEKDMLISQLKATIFELQQHEKDYDQLNSKYRKTQNDHSLLNEEKMRLEYELRQKDDNHSKQICDYRTEYENLQLQFNEKLALNKKLFAENDTLSKQLHMKDEEIIDLRERLNELMSQLEKSQEGHTELERVVNSLNDMKDSQKVQINNLFDDNKKLSKLCQEQDRSIKLGDQEKVKLLSQLDQAYYDKNNLTGKLQSREDSLNYTQAQLDEAKNLTLKLQGTIKDYERQFDLLKNEIETQKGALAKERLGREEEEKHNTQLKRLISEKERDVNRLTDEVYSVKALNRRTNDDKIGLQIENDKLRNHIIILTQQNEKLIAEIENIIDQDEQMKESLLRKDRIVALLRANKITLEKSLSNLDEFLNRSTNSLSKSPKYTYNRSSSPREDR